MSLSASWLKKPIVTALIASICIALAVSMGVGVAENPTATIKIGVLLPLTDPFGIASSVAIDMAVTEANALLEEAGAAWTLEVVVKDTEWKPDIALKKLEELDAAGIKFVVGPMAVRRF